MPKSTRNSVRPNERMASYRKRMRAAGLRPLQIWVPDSHTPDFDEICRRQAAVIASAESDDKDLRAFLDAALADLERLAR